MRLKYRIPARFPTTGIVFDMPLDKGFMRSTAVQDESQNQLHGTAVNSPVPKFPGFDFASVSSIYINIGTGPASVKTISLWIKPDGVAGTDSPIDLNGTDFLTIVTGTLTKNGFAGGTTVLYVDGMAATTITAAWHLIAITDTSAKNASNFDIGRETGNYYDGLIADVKLYSIVLSATDIKNLYELTRWRFHKDCPNNPTPDIPNPLLLLPD